MLSTSEALAKKVRWAIEKKGVTPARLQEETKVKSLSAITEWKTRGRVDKRHLPVLARLTQTRLEWWVRPDAPIPPTPEWLEGAPDHRPPVVRLATDEWPFRKFARARFDRLSRPQRRLVEAAAYGVLLTCEEENREKEAHRSKTKSSRSVA